MRELELLAPAKDKETAIAAIDHGADAVYIGAPMYGARAAAAVSVEDIAELCRYAHLYRAKVFVALNTILYDSELQTALDMIEELDKAGIDALIIQDRGLLEAELPPIPLHASTQCDNRHPDDIAELLAYGIERVVVARELGLEAIASLAQLPMEIEAFVHGALCVCYSGCCYLSQALAGRSANRGTCAQLCRIPYTLVDAKGKVISRDKHWLSLKDMNRLELLSEMAAAGVSSFKIEGRLKPIGYVKNVTAAYHNAIEQLVQRFPQCYQRASIGVVQHTFQPDVQRSFNRGFTSYLMKTQDKDPISSVLTPKSRGRYVGEIVSLKGNILGTNQEHLLNSGDGLLLISKKGKVEGTQVVKIIDKYHCQVNRIGQTELGTAVYCNRDLNFERLLSKPSATRRIPVTLTLRPSDEGFALRIDGPRTYRSVTAFLRTEKQQADRPNPDRLCNELTKLGQTPLLAIHTDVQATASFFIPASQLSQLRREAVELFCQKALDDYPLRRPTRTLKPDLVWRDHSTEQLTYAANVSNERAKLHYKRLGYRKVAPAFELEPDPDVALMTCKYCIKHELGHCPRLGQRPMPYTEPLYLRHTKGELRLFFDCRKCEMRLYAQ